MELVIVGGVTGEGVLPVGQRGDLATRILLAAGVDAANVGGGYATYRMHHPVG
ncbi:hypothetical protein J0H58_07615 [bacterium]|nr:hypothetical protein [bacterium]